MGVHPPISWMGLSPCQPDGVSTVSWMWVPLPLLTNSCENKKVLLHECKRQTTHCIASAHFADGGDTPSSLGWGPSSLGWGVPHPCSISGWGLPHPVLDREYPGYPHSRSGDTPSSLGWGFSWGILNPSLNSEVPHPVLDGGCPIPVPCLDGEYPIQSWTEGVPSHPDLGWGTPHLDLGWGIPIQT